MKKIILAALIAAPLCACDKAPKSDYDTVAAAVAGGEKIEVANDTTTTYYKVPASKELLAIYAQDKNAALNIGDPAFQNEEGNCIINVWDENDYRVFCGTAADVVADAPWAVAVTKPVAAEPAADAPAEQPADAAAPAVAE